MSTIIAHTPTRRQVIMVDDDQADLDIMEYVFRSSEINASLLTFSNPEEFLDWLMQYEQLPEDELPSLILLDLNMPKIDGLQVLEILKSKKTIKRIPVIIFSTSTAEYDVIQSYDRGANSYVVKPGDFNRLAHYIKGISQYWFDVAKRPPLTA